MIMKGFVVATAWPSALDAQENQNGEQEDYRQAQVKAIEVQKQADIMAAQAASAERVAMWNALSEAVKALKSASHMAIVAAVSTSSGNPANTVTRSNVCN